MILLETCQLLSEDVWLVEYLYSNVYIYLSSCTYFYYFVVGVLALLNKPCENRPRKVVVKNGEVILGWRRSQRYAYFGCFIIHSIVISLVHNRRI